ncbi:putative nitroreductase [Conoideocrella luteorostrata]|uniref:Nitroreductase n=1 Tax=Conoideocrella luteorostrata TaxID=1105319 RepID=A0AAJ0FZK0_9HYPO|nr:putative nitroreductase [Conoideocrella luteorostrata]
MSDRVSATQWLAAAKHRRSVYPLKNTSAVSDDRAAEIIKEVLSFSPSSYNTQPVRISLVVGDKQKELWDLVAKEAEPVLKGAGEEVWKLMSGHFQLFGAAHGSVLFWERPQTIKEAQETHKSAAHMFAQFGEHASGMAQILVWTAFELEGVGANLQHMGAFPTVEAALRTFCGVPNDYSLKANMNYGDEIHPHPEVPSKLPSSETLNIVR